jgi:hypothetical protein
MQNLAHFAKVRKNNKKQNRAEVENSFLKRKQRAGDLK